MKRYIILLTLNFSFLLFNSFAQTPNWQWAKSAAGIIDDVPTGVSTDADGNVYVTGYFQSPTLTFGSTVLNNSGNTNIFLTKFDSAGTVLWAKDASGSGNFTSMDVSVDGAGYVYITGQFSGSISFGSITLTSAVNWGIFIAKYDSSGNIIWAKSAGGNNVDAASGVSVDAGGNVYVTGYFSSDSITFGSTTLINTLGGFNDVFIVKYDSSGNVAWAKSAGGLMEDWAYSIATDGNGNAYITGSFNHSSLTFGSTTLYNAGIVNIFLTKYDSNGNVIWSKRSGGTGSDEPTNISTDIFGNVYLTGLFSSTSIAFGSTVLTNAGIVDIFISKYSGSGTILWANSAGGANYDGVKGVSTDALGNVYVGGHYRSSQITFDSISLTNAGGDDIFLTKYDSIGNIIWAKSAGGWDWDRALGVSTIVAGNVYVIGQFRTPSLSFNSTTLTNTGAYDIFISKLATSNCSSHFTLFQDTIPHNWIAINQATGTPPISYVWNWGDGSSTSSGATPSHIYVNPGYYNVCLSIVDSLGCTTTYCDSSTYLFRGTSTSTMVTLNVTLPTAITEYLVDENSIVVFPNPLFSEAIVQTHKLLHNATLTVDNIFGETIKQIKNISGQSFTLQRGNLPGGLYVIQLTENNKTIATKKLVIID